jgi:hypothetical protein
VRRPPRVPAAVAVLGRPLKQPQSLRPEWQPQQLKWAEMSFSSDEDLTNFGESFSVDENLRDADSFALQILRPRHAYAPRQRKPKRPVHRFIRLIDTDSRSHHRFFDDESVVPHL